jgi:hypothetical protein
MLRARMDGAWADLAGARSAVAEAWAGGTARHRAALAIGLAVGAALIGAFLFGAWHVLFGFFVKGNPRAGLFGLVLAAISGSLFALGTAIVRRRLPPA